MKTVILNALQKPEQSAAEAARLLKNGGIVAIPTETVYGLAGNAFDEHVAEKIYKAKGRPSDNPLIVHISSADQWKELVTVIPDSARDLSEKYWPGPLTIILPKSEKIPDAVSGNLNTVAVRMPNHKVALSIIEKAGVPLAAPSANTSGRPSPTTASHVINDLMGKADAIVDGGDCEFGVESTVISFCFDVPRILRPGAVTPDMIAQVVGEVEIDDAVYHKLAEGEAPISPGTKYKHYSPEAKVILVRGEFDNYKKYVEENADEATFALCFEGEDEALSVSCVTYGKKNDSLSQAKNIFDALRRVDELGAERVYARFPDEDGVGLAVFNRLVRAAAFNIVEV